MQTLNYTEEYLRRRKFYLLLPLLALPFLTFIYWVLVVKNLKSEQVTTVASGLQLSLPDASLKDEPAMDKWQYYRKADQDSALRIQQIKRDPYRNGDVLITPIDTLYSHLRGLDAPDQQKKGRGLTSQVAREHSNHEVQVQQKLRDLEKAMTSTHSPTFAAKGRDIVPPSSPVEQKDIARLEALLKPSELQTHAEEVDPELAQLNSMLDKILAIQNPDQTAQLLSSNQIATARPSLPVTVLGKENIVSILSGQNSKDSVMLANQVTVVGFFGLNEEEVEPENGGLTAVIEKTQQLVSGATVQLRLTRPINVSGQAIPENTFIYGIASLSGERLKIKITSISSNEKILPVNLGVYDLDGIEGIYIPGTISRNVTKQALGSQVQGADYDVGGFSLGAQAANAGMQIGRTLLGRKTRLTQVTLQEGYKVILRDDTNTQTQILSSHEK
ncbi:conjugative transposon TraM protein [Dyadobacter sp. BE34]|uniref:Conjugative transposon TraM protein n=1 Tax=Dyadobacter fermentans TaxID=94254 RepID=A0ABU1R8J5_9BACT|nr:MULTISPECIES: conjugative transposon protein TraM [Dyadobacter]MDR6809683.1 conjugative transposon TraM protein [Dyadobacter fermentans]MDR7047361.1 conjugative transposon TraM protein [Dyadobacter sp. BE242]MDR7201596.1 conjugative transposon TraM protein [Dyadobacter sp. BE34]MDR7219466.1 conjugative transposon TraM protein [Dyadobacter sp. BE31]MDR7267139.1 conjugative transposon TraM protein [Dyadobacter sp. BE32]